jgi:hypothetical protein
VSAAESEAPATRPPVLVFAAAPVLREAERIIGRDVCLECLVARAIDRGQARRIARPGEPRLREGEYVVQPFDCDWVAVVSRGPGRIVTERQPQAWHVQRVRRLGRA